MKKPGQALKLVLSSIFKKVNTEDYPRVKKPINAGFRGKLKFYPEKCIGCKLCMKDCPTGAITINKVGEKKFEMVLDLGKCVYCVQCVDTCPKDAIDYTQDFELAQLDPEKLVITFHAETDKSDKK